jgi:serine/threonine protein kinase/tetratricopeptide (TPR) repeat protein
MIGKTVSHYKILEKLGEGGMGVVYEAEDTKLKRTVALKFLPPELTRDLEAKERFIREAQAASALQHHNICTIHDIDETPEGQLFIVMDCYEGETLKNKIKEKRIKKKEVVDIAIQIGQGLEKAHEKGIIHRDIKPANIFITNDGVVKILDFGLAKLSGQAQLTKDSSTLGTVAYMSPEQLSGKEVDQRTDIWSLGVVLYEMLTEKLPFKGDYEQAVTYSILNEQPESVTSLRTGVPMELEHIVNKCLQKDPDERYQTVIDLVADFLHLQRTSTIQTISPSKGTPGVSHPSLLRKYGWIFGLCLALFVITIFILRPFFLPEKPSDSKRTMIVVLPFQNLGSPDDEYFADGITDAITARLANLSGLGVISRQSAIQYKGSVKTTSEIREELGVDYLLEGTIQRERPSDPRSRVRIIPQLIKAEQDIHLWAETYDEDITEVFRVQSDIAERVAHELDITLLAPERDRLESKPTENIEAYEYYLRGIEYFDRATSREESQTALEMFAKAVELDPGFALAWIYLSRVYIWFYWSGMEEGKIVLPKAETAANEALSIAPDLVETHLALGFIQYYGNRNYDKALEHFHEVLKQQPTNAEANSAIGYVLRRKGKFEESLGYFRRALKVNPRSYLLNWDNMGGTLLTLRRYTEAEKYTDRAISLAPEMSIAYILKADISLLRDGDIMKAREYLLQCLGKKTEAEKCMYQFLPDRLNICFPDPCERVNLWYPSVQDCRTGKQDSSFTIIVSSANYYIEKSECLVKSGQREHASALLDSARDLLEQDLPKDLDIASYAYRSSMLGIIYAKLGRQKEALREAKRAVEIFPLSMDANEAPWYIENLAQMYTLSGEYEAAIDQLELLLSIPYEISVTLIRIDPTWDPLRDNPRFQKLMKKYAEVN